MIRRIGVISLSLGISASAFATNGSNMIGFGAVSSAMGGIGIATPIGPESVLKNASLIKSESNFEFLFAGTYFAPTVEAQGEKSAADTFMIPAIGFTQNLNENFTVGLGAYGTSGLGVDYRDTEATDGLYRMSTALSIMKFTPAISYNKNNFSFGVSTAIVYGTLGLSYDRTPGTTGIGSEGAGTSDDLGLGYTIGTSYVWNNLTVGLNYQSEIEMEYKHQLADSVADFGITDPISDKLNQPAEYGIGLSYKLNNLIVGFDVKQILWASAEGYKQFGWDDQTVFGVGASYKFDKLTVRAGFNTATSPLGDNALENTGADIPINILNGLGFPAIVESHYTAGLGYDFSQSFNLDFATTYAPEESIITSMGASDLEVTHSQISATLAGHWKY